jgi:hypothetical protein
VQFFYFVVRKHPEKLLQRPHFRLQKYDLSYNPAGMDRMAAAKALAAHAHSAVG